jgi:hypothetical protein
MVSYQFAGVEILWTDHAIKRAKERFRYDVPIDNEAIVWAFLRNKMETFEVKSDLAILACKRDGQDKVVILTVYPAAWKKKLFRVKRKKRKRYS